MAGRSDTLKTCPRNETKGTDSGLEKQVSTAKGKGLTARSEGSNKGRKIEGERKRGLQIESGQVVFPPEG